MQKQIHIYYLHIVRFHSEYIHIAGMYLILLNICSSPILLDENFRLKLLKNDGAFALLVWNQTSTLTTNDEEKGSSLKFQSL